MEKNSLYKFVLKKCKLSRNNATPLNFYQHFVAHLPYGKGHYLCKKTFHPAKGDQFISSI